MKMKNHSAPNLETAYGVLDELRASVRCTVELMKETVFKIAEGELGKEYLYNVYGTLVMALDHWDNVEELHDKLSKGEDSTKAA